MIVDCHVHLFPERLGSAVRRFFDANTDAELLYPLDHREVLDRHLVDGITTVWNLPYARKRGMAAELNRSMLGVSAGLSDHEVMRSMSYPAAQFIRTIPIPPATWAPRLRAAPGS